MLNPTRTPPDLPGRTSHTRWNILALLTLGSFVAYLLRTNMSIAGLRMMAELGLSQVQLGWVLAAFAWGYAIFQFPGGLLGEWWGGRKALTVIAVIWVFSTCWSHLSRGVRRPDPSSSSPRSGRCDFSWARHRPRFSLC